jgi:hypothetical protein
MIDFRKKEVIANPEKDKFSAMLRDYGFISMVVEGVDVWRLKKSNLLYLKTYDKKYSVHLFCMEETYLVKSQLYINFDYSKVTNLIQHLIENQNDITTV